MRAPARPDSLDQAGDW